MMRRTQTTRFFRNKLDANVAIRRAVPLTDVEWIIDHCLVNRADYVPQKKWTQKYTKGFEMCRLNQKG